MSKEKKILINYADKAYGKAQHLNTWTGKHIAHFDKVIEYGPDDIDAVFYEEHKNILNVKRGNGLWLWKPYFIHKTLSLIDYGDIVFYCDSGAFFFRNPKVVFDILEKQDIYVSVLPLIEKQFTKLDTFKIMGLYDNKYMDSPQISGTYIAVRKSEYSLKFVQEWLSYCCDINVLAAPETKEKEVPEFYAHREDQSILSLLVKKYNIKAYSDPSQYGRLPEKYKNDNFIMSYYKKEDYKPFIIHHRTKDCNVRVIFKQYLCAILSRKVGLLFIRMK